MSDIRSLYVHVPFCRHRCAYCDFYSQVLDPGAVTPFVDAALRELDAWVTRRSLRFDTIYVGGGTPTVLPCNELRRLLTTLRAHGEPGQTEFSVEANPGTIGEEVATALVEAGVNRVSIGAQSYNADELRVLDRIHTPDQTHETVALCRRCGIPRLNLDLIFGIPGQTGASWVRNLETALALEPDHMSCYGLTYEPGTRLHAALHAGLIERVDHDLEADMYEEALRTLPSAGLAHYEISNFARPGAACRHNLSCWHNEPYLGIGPGAAGFVDDVRYKNVSDTAAYVAALRAGRSTWGEHECLPPRRRACETAMLELRLTTGIERRRFAERHGQDPVELFAAAIERHAKGGLLEVSAERVRLTRAGLLIADRVIADFL